MMIESGIGNQDGPVLLGKSAVISRLRDDIAAAARTSAKVLILGETGVGKEVVARLIHEQSARRGRPLVAVNCSGIPETLLESELFGHVRGSFTGAIRDRVGLAQQAHRGTLFLDELGEMSLRMQAALLRFTETGEVQRVGADSGAIRTDVRLVTATNRDLRARIAEGSFREDLFYRLNVIQIQIPPLRERGEDVLLLLEYYLALAAQAHELAAPTLTPDAAQLLLSYAWPGNVRELRNVTERMVVQNHALPLRPEDLPSEIREACRRPELPPSPTPTKDADQSVASLDSTGAARVDAAWARFEAGEDFWAVVYEAFKARELTRGELLALVDRGLRETRGSYRQMLRVFNLEPSDYKRFHAFLYQQRCNLPVGPYRTLKRVARSRQEHRDISDVRPGIGGESAPHDLGDPDAMDSDDPGAHAGLSH